MTAATVLRDASTPLTPKVLDSRGGPIFTHLERLIDFGWKSYLKVSVDNPSRVRTSLI